MQRGAYFGHDFCKYKTLVEKTLYNKPIGCKFSVLTLTVSRRYI